MKIIKIDYLGQITEHIIIDHGNDQFTSMLKSTYDEQLAQSKEIVTPVK